jgi:hypothetical protein
LSDREIQNKCIKITTQALQHNWYTGNNLKNSKK